MSTISQLFTQLPNQWQLLLLVLPILSLLVIARRSSAEKGLKLPPGPARLPVLGNLHQLGTLPHRSLRELARWHGPVMLLRLGATRMLVVSLASAAREVLQTHDADCCSRAACPGPERLSYGFKDLVFAPYGEGWRERRKVLVSELLSMRGVKAAWGARRDQVDVLMAALTNDSGKPVALGELVFALIDGIIGTVALGSLYGKDMLAAGKKRRFQNVLDEAMQMLGNFSGEDFFPNAAGRLVDRMTGIVARREQLFSELDAFYEMVIEEHLKPSSDKGVDLIDALISLWKEGRGITRDHIKAVIMDTFLGGVEPSSVTILWAMSELVRKPRVLNKVQGEIRAAVGGNDRVQPEDLPKLSYLKLVVKETLRLYPPGTLLVPRETMRHVTIGGYDVPAMTRVSVNVWAIGRDTATWGEDAEEFDPDRFLGSSEEVDLQGTHFQLLPFGAGRRICPGIAMALMNMEFTLANMLCGFDWALPEGMKAEDLCMEEAGGITFHRKTPLVLVPTPYRPAA